MATLRVGVAQHQVLTLELGAAQTQVALNVGFLGTNAVVKVQAVPTLPRWRSGALCRRRHESRTGMLVEQSQAVKLSATVGALVQLLVQNLSFQRVKFFVAVLARDQLPFVRVRSAPAPETLAADVALAGQRVFLVVGFAVQGRAAVQTLLRARVLVEVSDVVESAAALVTLDVGDIQHASATGLEQVLDELATAIERRAAVVALCALEVLVVGTFVAGPEFFVAVGAVEHRSWDATAAGLHRRCDLLRTWNIKKQTGRS